MRPQTLTQPLARPRFSGHETFPVRYDWMRKLLSENDINSDELADLELQPVERDMLRFGVGKNMVRSMQHWARVMEAANVDSSPMLVKPFGRVLRDIDPYLESVGTIWAMHWRISTNAQLAMTWFYLFNVHPAATVSIRSAAEDLERFAFGQGWKVPSTATLQRDVECFLRCYAVGRDRRGELTEDSIECPLAELELLRPTPDRGVYELQRGPKPTLPDEVFVFALDEFWAIAEAAGTVSFDKIAHAPGSPGRVFLLDEASLSFRLERLEDVSRGAFSWSDTAGLQQVTRNRPVDDPVSLLVAACKGSD